MLTFDRPNFASGKMYLKCPEQVKNEKGEMETKMVIYTFQVANKGNSYEFPNEKFMKENYGLYFRECPEHAANLARKKKNKDESDARFALQKAEALKEKEEK